MFRQLLIFGAMLLVAHGAVAQGRIETPRNGTTISGKAIFSGWYCNATEITISIDGAEQLPWLTAPPGAILSRTAETAITVGACYTTLVGLTTVRTPCGLRRW